MKRTTATKAEEELTNCEIRLNRFRSGAACDLRRALAVQAKTDETFFIRVTGLGPANGYRLLLAEFDADLEDPTQDDVEFSWVEVVGWGIWHVAWKKSRQPVFHRDELSLMRRHHPTGDVIRVSDDDVATNPWEQIAVIPPGSSARFIGEKKRLLAFRLYRLRSGYDEMQRQDAANAVNPANAPTETTTETEPATETTVEAL